MMRAKIAAYTQGQAAGRAAVPGRPARLPPRSMATRSRPFSTAIRAQRCAKIDALVGAQPNNAYFHEMRGDVLMKANRPAEPPSASQRACGSIRHPACCRSRSARRCSRPATPERCSSAVAELREGLDARPRICHRLSLSRAGLWPARARSPRPSLPRRKAISIAATTSDAQDLRGARPAEAAARLARLAARTGHHQLSEPPGR